MGNTSSIFYPDNGRRRARAEQLSNDCRYAQSQYDSAKADIEATLGPYKDKVDKVLLAFGCANLDELDKLVLQNATGKSLERWNQVRSTYDKSLIVDQVLMVAEGVVAVAGFAISAVGALAGGFGFFFGMGVTADILLILGVIGAIFDIINGAIQRSELRKAINSLVPARLKARYVQMQMNQLQKSLPNIEALYQIFEKCGYNQEQILQAFKDDDSIKSLSSDAANITFTNIGELLASMDRSRGAWTKEDPAWRPIASHLDTEHKSSRSEAHAIGVVAQSDVTSLSRTHLLAAQSQGMDDTELVHDSELHIRFANVEEDTVFSGQSFHVVLKSFEGDHHALVRLQTEDGRKALTANIKTKSVSLAPITIDTTDWMLSFVNPDDATAFATHRKDFDLRRRPTSATIHIQVAGLFLTTRGTLTSSAKDQPSAELRVVYA